ncbi:MAG TPA: 4Fe-4S binding protein, partial [Armatimonadetes bacterium]|nr:4Fe-4S binding protein [Armatimonadota bacterium]
VFFFCLFMFLVFVTTFGRMKGYPVSLFLQIDPLIAIASAISSHALYRELIWSLVIIIPTLLLGRFFCGWVCPFGALNQFIGWLFNVRPNRERIESNRYRPLFTIKYYVLAFTLVAAAFGSLQIGWLDPICLLHRSIAIAVLPAIDMPTHWIYVRPHEHHWAWLIGFIFFTIVALNLLIQRFFCRVLCPLGALLGILARFSLWRIHRDEDKCVHCGLCLKSCEGASDPHEQLRKSECMVCFNCIEDCPHDALNFKLMPPVEGEVTNPDWTRRRLVLAGFTGLVFYPFARLSATVYKSFDKRVIRPPGAVPEPEFLARCVKCGQCIRVCPTNVLQPAMYEAGIEGIFTPIMDMKLGYCELNCTLCGQVCPTGAIQRISIEQKLGLGEFAEEGPIRIGTAFYDRGRCLPWAMDIPCVVCQEVCPVSPKAIFTRDVEVTRRDGSVVKLQRPYVDPARCV